MWRQCRRANAHTCAGIAVRGFSGAQSGATGAGIAGGFTFARDGFVFLVAGRAGHADRGCLGPVVRGAVWRYARHDRAAVLR